MSDALKLPYTLKNFLNSPYSSSILQSELRSSKSLRNTFALYASPFGCRLPDKDALGWLQVIDEQGSRRYMRPEYSPAPCAARLFASPARYAVVGRMFVTFPMQILFWVSPFSLIPSVRSARLRLSSDQ